MTDAAPTETISRFRALHESGCFVLPNPWDAGTASFLEHLGFRALATTSAGFAFSRGLPDAAWAVPRDLMLEHIAQMVRATTLPVNADFESGYAHAPEALYENVQLCAATGVAGLSIEDATGDAEAPLYGRELAVQRIRASRAAIDAGERPVVLTARCEAFLVREANAFEVARDRLVAYAEAGADCLYAPGVRDREQIAELVRAVAPKSLNVLISAPVPGLTVQVLAELGVRRISVGSGLARAAWGGFLRAARDLLSGGTFEPFADAAPFSELNDLFLARRRLE